MIIGLCGYPYSGKTEIAKYLVEHYRNVERMNFADGVKKMVLQLHGVEPRHVYGTKADKEEVIPALGVSGRYLMETLGTKWGRELVKPTIWLDQAMAEANKADAYGNTIVFDDVRFHNEVDAIKNDRGVVLRITRPGVEIDFSLPANQQIADLQHSVEIVNAYDGPEWLHKLCAEVIVVLTHLGSTLGTEMKHG